MRPKNNFYLLKELLKLCEISVSNKVDNTVKVVSAADLEKSKKNYISAFFNPKYIDLLKKTKASTIIINKKYLKYLPKGKIALLSDYPEIDFAKVLNFFYPNSYFSKIGYESLSIDKIKEKYKKINFGLNFYVEKNVSIGKNVFIGNNVTIKKDCIIGNNVIIGCNVVIENSIIHDDVHICDGSIIGKKGFGFKFLNNKCVRIPHFGKVIINKGCEIGANCVIDRGSVRNTVIGENTFMDNFVQIAHNVVIGKKCILASQVGIAGSTFIGDNVVIGGQAGISGHLVIGNNVKIGGKSGVIKNITDGQMVMGYPATSFKEFVKKNK